MKIWKKSICMTLLGTLAFATTGCGNKETATMSMANDVSIVCSNKSYSDAKIIKLSTTEASLDGENIQEYSYTWNCDPTVAHDEVENAPAEYYTGEKPNADAAVYIDHEMYYYPALSETDFQLVNYDGEREWAYYYKDGENEDYIFATLPYLNNALPNQMMHTKEEADQNKVLHITVPGTYVLTGAWKGQIKVDLGDTDDVFADENAKVTLILDGADIECSVAPGIIFYNVYECDNTWEDSERTDATIHTELAGANIVLADNSENYVSGTNVFRMLKTKYKDEDSKDEVKAQKKLRKTDGALYSYMTMNIGGEASGNGKLTVDAGYEGIDSELHLNVKGGMITINSQDDGMNVNEDHVSVISFAGGEVTINPALGAEGDGVDSNGYIALNGGTVRVNGVRIPDNALDSEDGIYYNSGALYIDGTEQQYETGSVFQSAGGKQMGEMPRGDRDFMRPDGVSDFDIKEFKEKVAELGDDATYEDVLELLGMRGNDGGPRGERPEGFEPNGDRESEKMQGEFEPNGDRPDDMPIPPEEMKQ